MNNELAAWAARWNIGGYAMAELSRLFDPSNHATESDGSESVTQSQIRVTASNMGFAMWRNNNGAMIDAKGRSVRFGLGNMSARLSKVWKSSDLIGIGPNGRFVACEVKAPGWNGPRNDHERAQRAYLTTVESLGGIGMFATSVNDYVERMKCV